MTDKVDPKKTETDALKQGTVHRDLVEFDEGINVATLGPIDDTISSRALRWKLGLVPHPNILKKWAGSALCAFLGVIQKKHDLRAQFGDYARAKAEEERTKKVIEASGLEPDDTIKFTKE